MKSRTAVVLSLALGLTGPTWATAQEKGEGPATLVISYKCRPETRVAFRDHMETKGAAQFERWRKDGVVAGYQLLFSSYVNAATWDMLAVLSFESYVGQARWKEVERRMPGGLAAEALALASPVTSYLADLTWRGATATKSSGPPVFVVIPYLYENRAQYKGYAEGYVIPQVKGWLAEGVLASYSLYLNQNEAGDPWDALFVLEYRDLQGLALRRATVNKVRVALQSNAEWKALSDAKQTFRKEGEIVIADPVVPR